MVHPNNASARHAEQQPVSGDSGSPRVDECRRLVAKVYLDKGYITDENIDDAGFINERIDPHVSHSDYFWLPEDTVRATARMIRHPLDRGDWQFPMESDFKLQKIPATYINYLRETHPQQVVEISALAKDRGVDKALTFDIYRAIWQHAKRSNYKACLVSADEQLDVKLRGLFGDALHKVGDTKHYLGSPTVPSILSPHQCASAMSKIYRQTLSEQGQETADNYKSVINYLKDGLEPAYFSGKEKVELQQIGISID